MKCLRWGGQQGLCRQRLPCGNCLSPLQPLLRYTSFYRKSPSREVLGHRHSGLQLGVTKLQPADKAAAAVGTFSIFSTPCANVARGEEIPHTHSCAYPPNSPLSSSDLESLKSSTGQSSDTGWAGIWAIRVRLCPPLIAKSWTHPGLLQGRRISSMKSTPCALSQKRKVSPSCGTEGERETPCWH